VGNQEKSSPGPRVQVGRGGRIQRRLALVRSTFDGKRGRIDAPLHGPERPLRRLRSLAEKVIRAIPKLGDPRYVATRLRKLGTSARRRLPLPVHRDPMTGKLALGWPAPGTPSGLSLLIIPVGNDGSRIYECLQSLREVTAGPTYEVIVVDNGTDINTRRLQSQIRGIVWSRDEHLLSLAARCNRGAERARGDQLVFLSADALVTPGWLSALARTFQDFPTAGLVGPKLMLLDGRLDAAGASVWRDGSRTRRGAFGDGGHSRYNFARAVDYCSATCVMVARSVFAQVGGFDPDYQASGYHDVDLAFKVHEAGFRVMYQPCAKVVHRHEPVIDPAQIDATMIPIQNLFRERWRHRLDRHAQPPQDRSGVEYAAGEESLSRGQGRVLVIDHRIPTPDRDCGSLRMMEIMRGFLKRGHCVTLVPDNMMVFSPYLEELQAQGIEVVYPPYHATAREYLERHGREFALAIISRADVATRHLDAVKQFAPDAKVVFDTVDLHFVREARQAAFAQDPELGLAVGRRKDQELGLVRKADLTLVVSTTEKGVLDKECAGVARVRIMPTIYPVFDDNPPGFVERRDIVFIGGFDHAPNVDAVVFFVNEILPLVWKQIPSVMFRVIGPDPTPIIRQLASSRVEIMGFVPDVKPVFDRARVAVAPIRFGAGVKGKVNQSMSLGVPTVVTSIAAEGMYLSHEENAMIADEPAGFADAVVRLWTSRELWERVSRRGFESLKEHFSVEAAAKPIDELLDWAGLTSRANAGGYHRS
jgi:GT2 family glycosyltransferase/glycosyltransferase involved in cell wall biosynthesis